MFLTSNFVPSGTGARATTSIVNGASSGGVTPFAITYAGTVKQTLSGALTAATLKQMINISGSAGSMSILGITSVDATARTLRIKITADSVVIFDSTSASVAVLGQGFLAAGAAATAPVFDDGNPIRWRTSLLVEIASSLTETDKVTIGYKYNLES